MENERRGFFRKAGGAAALVASGGTRAEASSAQARDRALWISWYDVPEAGRDAYLDWLHRVYMPALLRRPDFLWAAHYAAVPRGTVRTIRRDGKPDPRLDPSLPTGDRYILLFGAENANVFGDPAPSALNASLDRTGRNMLAMRTGERVNIMVEAARVAGPEATGYASGMTPTPCIQLGNFNCAYQDEEDMLAWYAQSRMPAMATLPGCVRTRRLASVAGWAKHAILYEFTTLEARNRYYVKLEDGRSEAKAWADRIVPKLIHAPGSASLATRIWPAA